MLRKFIELWVFTGLVILASPVHAASTQGIVDRIQDQYATLRSFQTEFVQELSNASTKEIEIRRGRIFFRQPQLIRWETDTPEQEVMIVGKDLVWNYIPDEKVAMKYHVSQIIESKTMLKFLSGQAHFAEDFKVTDQGEDRGWIKLKLIPKKPEPNLVLAYIWVDKKSALLQQVLIVDFFGNGNQVTLQKLRLDGSVDEGLFIFTPPPGVKVRDNTKQ